MDRREFLKCGGIALAGAAMGAASPVPWLEVGSAFAAPGTKVVKFGVMADTQWKANKDGVNPGTSAIGLINQLNL